jgi:hypothetical protein
VNLTAMGYLFENTTNHTYAIIGMNPAVLYRAFQPELLVNPS